MRSMILSPTMLLFAGLVATAAETGSTNLAATARITASSAYNADYQARFVADGRIPADNDAGQAWAVDGSTHRNGADLVFTWDAPITAAQILYHGRTAFGLEECWKDWELYLDDATVPAAKGRFQKTADAQAIDFKAPLTARVLRLHFTSSWGGQNPGAAEVEILSRAQTPQDREARSAITRMRTGFTRDCLTAWERELDEAAAQPAKTARVATLRPRLAAVTARFPVLRAALDGDPASVADELAALTTLAHDIHALKLDGPLLFVKRHAYFSGHIYDDYFCWHPGGGIYVIENPWETQERQVVRAIIDPSTAGSLGTGVYRDPDVSWDGTHLLFAFKGEAKGDTSIYEIGIDGTGLRRVTDPACACKDQVRVPGTLGEGQHDVNPAYLPDGRIVFTSTRTGAHVMCFSSRIDTLHTMNADGSDLRCISVNNQNEFDPTVLPDGRLLYGRWEYIDKTALYMQSLWTANPDGSQETAYYKNNLAKPTAVLDARPVPGTDLVVGSLTPHNGQSVGAIALIDVKKGKNSLDAITNLTPEYPTAMDQGLTRGPCDPWPLSQDVVLIANNAAEHGAHAVIEMIDRFGFRSVIRREADIGCFAPMPVAARPRPPVIPSRIQPGQPAAFLVDDVYHGMEGIERGTVKWLRLVETTARVSGIPPGGRWWNQAFLVSWQGSYDVKRFLGIVPVDEDGSAHFTAPPGKALYFQALDQDLRLVQSQRTFVQAVPGMTRSCSGCHIKDDNLSPQVNRSRLATAARRAPSVPKPESWGEGFVDYPTMIQPVLDRNCVACHGGAKGVDAGVDLSGGWTWAFSISYETLIARRQIGYLNCNNGAVRTAEILPPRTHGSGAAPLASLLLSGHGGRIGSMTAVEKRLLMAWMDGNANYHGTWDYTPAATCNAIKDTAVRALATMKAQGCTGCHAHGLGHDWINLQTPEHSRILRAPLAAAAGGLAWCRERPADKPAFGLVINGVQPPDVFTNPPSSTANHDGKVQASFADTTAAGYQELLAIIRAGRDAALATPRVDMPGAQPTPGRCRDLEPLAPPAPTGREHAALTGQAPR